MKPCIRDAFFILAIIAALTFCFPTYYCSARDPNAGYSTIYGHTVFSEPGEDPHLRTEPNVNQEAIGGDGAQGGGFGARPDPIDPFILEGSQGRSVPGRDIRVNLNWRILMQIIISVSLK